MKGSAMRLALAALPLLLPCAALAQDYSQAAKVTLYSAPAAGVPSSPLGTPGNPMVVTGGTGGGSSGGGSATTGTAGTPATGAGASTAVYDAISGKGLLTAGTALPAGDATLGRTGLPRSTATGPANTATSPTPLTTLPLFAAGTISYGCYIQNKASNGSAIITIDWGGGTQSNPISPEDIAPGQAVSCQFVPSTAVNFWSSTASVAINGGKF